MVFKCLIVHVQSRFSAAFGKFSLPIQTLWPRERGAPLAAFSVALTSLVVCEEHGRVVQPSDLLQGFVKDKMAMAGGAGGLLCDETLFTDLY